MVKEKRTFRMSPNPTTDISILSVDIVSENLNVRILDFVGREMSKVKLNGSSLVLRKGELGSGIFQCILEDGDDVVGIQQLMIL